MAKPDWTYRQFVLAWQRATTAAEVGDTFGLTAKQTSRIANRLRQRGIRLKKLHRGASATAARMGNDSWMDLANLCEAKNG